MENNIQSKMPIIEFNMLFLQKIRKSMILNLSFSNYRSFKGECSFTTEPTASKAKMNNLCEVETQAEGVKQALKISLIFGANASGKTNIIKFMTVPAWKFRKMHKVSRCLSHLTAKQWWHLPKTPPYIQVIKS